jgi:hypothetical protein
MLIDRGFQGAAADSIFLHAGSTEDTWQRVAFAMTTHALDGVLRLQPIVGVIWEPLELIVARLTDRTYNRLQVITLRTNVGYLRAAGGFLEYPIPAVPDTEQLVEKVVLETLQLGDTFWNKFHRFEEIRAALRDYSLTSRMDADLREPCALILDGNVEDAKALVRTRLAEIGDKKGPWFDLYRGFAGRLAATCG